MMQQQQISPEKLFAIIGEQQVQAILLREQLVRLAQMLAEKSAQLEIASGALAAMRGDSNGVTEEVPAGFR